MALIGKFVAQTEVTMTDSAGVREAERSRFLAARYPQLRGLRVVPWGVVVVLASLVTGSLVTGPGWWVVLGLFLASIPAAVALTWVSNHHYRRRFGEVRSKPPSGMEVLGWFVAFGVLAVLVVALRAVVGDGPVSIFGLQAAAILAFTAWRMGPFALHRLLLAGLLAFASVLPLGLLTDAGMHPVDQHLLMIIGVFLVVVGLVDHRLLVRAFGTRTGLR